MAGLVPRPYIFDLQSAIFPRGRYEDAAASSTEPRGLDVLAVQATYNLQSAYQTAFADFLCFIIRNRRCSLTFLSGFTSREYHVIRVDFIVALRRTKGRGRRTLRSPPSPSSGLHLIHPGRSASAGHICCRGLIPIQVAVFRCCRYSPVPNIVWLSVFGL